MREGFDAYRTYSNLPISPFDRVPSRRSQMKHERLMLAKVFNLKALEISGWDTRDMYLVSELQM